MDRTIELSQRLQAVPTESMSDSSVGERAADGPANPLGMKLSDWRDSVEGAVGSLKGARALASEVAAATPPAKLDEIGKNLPEFLEQIDRALVNLGAGIDRAIARAPVILEQSQIHEQQAGAEKAQAQAKKAEADANRANTGSLTDVIGQWPADSLADRLTAIGSALLGSGSLSLLAFRPDPTSYLIAGPAALWLVGLVVLGWGLKRTAVFTRRRRAFFEDKFGVKVPE